MKSAQAVPFSHPVSVHDVPAKGRVVTISANADERAALAELLKIPEVKKLEARFELKPWAGGGLQVTGEVEGDVVLTCVVTLEDFASSVHEEVDARFAAEADNLELAPGAEHEADLDAPDALENGRADLGQLAAEHLALGIDPYPRKPGVEAGEAAEEEPKAPPATHRPFAGLDRLVAAAKPAEKPQKK